MANFIVDPYTGILVPTPGVDPGPDYAENVSNALTKLSSLTHTGASNLDGLQIPTAGIDIDEDLSAQNNNIIDLRSTRYEDQSTVLSGSGDVDCLYFKNGDAWINNGAGTPVQLTSGSLVNIVVSDNYPSLTINSNHTINSIDPPVVFNCNTTSVSIILTLPLANSVAVGRFYLVKDGTGTSETHNITVNAAGGDNIDGGSSFLIADNYTAIGLVSDGIGKWLLFQYDRKIYRAGEILQLTNGAALTSDSASPVNLGGSLQVTSAFGAVLSKLEVVGTATFDSDVIIIGPVVFSDSVTVTGDATVNGDTNLNTLETSGKATLNSLEVTNATSMLGPLAVSGNISGSSNLNISAVTTTNSLHSQTTSALDGAVTAGSTLSVAGASSLHNTTITGTLGVTGAVTAQSTLAVTGNIAGGAGLGLTGSAVIGGTLGVTGNVTVNAGVDCQSLNVVHSADIDQDINLGSLFKYQTTKTFTRVIPYLVTKLSWVPSGITDGAWTQASIDNTGYLIGPVRVPNGAIITSISSTWRGNTGHSNPISQWTLPVLTLERLVVTTGTNLASVTANDLSLNTAAYEAIHNLSAAASITVDNETTLYYLKFVGELDGSQSAITNGICFNGSVTYTVNQLDLGGY